MKFKHARFYWIGSTAALGVSWSSVPWARTVLFYLGPWMLAFRWERE